MRMSARLLLRGFIAKLCVGASIVTLAPIAPGALAQAPATETRCDKSDFCRGMYAAISRTKQDDIETTLLLSRDLTPAERSKLKDLLNRDLNARIADHISQRFGYGLSSAEKRRTLSAVSDEDLKGWLFDLAKTIDSPPKEIMSAELKEMAAGYDFPPPDATPNSSGTSPYTFNPITDDFLRTWDIARVIYDNTKQPGADRTELLKDRTRVTVFTRNSSSKFRTLISAFGSQRLDSNTNIVDAQSNLASVLEETLFNHFNVDYNKIPWYAGMGTGGYEPTIHEKMFTTFHELLSAVIRHPAMLRYLDNHLNSYDLSTGLASNQNLGRELLELHTLGLGPDRYWRKLDGNVSKARLYTQKDVENSSLLLTGINTGVDGNTKINNLLHVKDWEGSQETAPVVMKTKFCLGGKVIDEGDPKKKKEDCPKPDPKHPMSNSDQQEAIEAQLDSYLLFLSQHERTKINICNKLVARFVAPYYDPTGLNDDLTTSANESVVEVQRRPVFDRCISAWGKKGDLKAIYKAILTSPEAWQWQNHGRMVKNPNDLVISAIRASGLTVKDLQKAEEMDALGVALVRELEYLGLPYRRFMTPTGYNEQSGWLGQGLLVRWISSSFRLASFLESRSSEDKGELYAPIMGIPNGGAVAKSAEEECRDAGEKETFDACKSLDLRTICSRFSAENLCPLAGGHQNCETLKQEEICALLSAEPACMAAVLGTARYESIVGAARYASVRKLLGYGDARGEAGTIQARTKQMMSRDGSRGKGEQFRMIEQKFAGKPSASCVKSGLTSITASPRFMKH